MRLIDADNNSSNESSILVLSELRGRFNCFDEKEKEFYEALSNAIRVLRKEMLWIPVEEKLPNNDEWKIITILDDSGDNPYSYTDFGWYLKSGNCWIVHDEMRSDVIAWMDLPVRYGKE